VPLTQASSIDGNVEMLGERSFWLGLAGILDRPDTMTAVRDALDSRWRAAASVPAYRTARVDPVVALRAE